MNMQQFEPLHVATMADVAAHAGVSLKTVSRVVNNEPHVSAKLRARVEAAIAALDYEPDLAARSLAGARSFTIGLLFDNPSPNYTMKVQAGTYRLCREMKYHLRIDNLDSTSRAVPMVEQLNMIVRHGRVDGFVVTPPLCDNLMVLDFLESRQLRYSRIAPVVDPGRSPSVLIDDAAAGACVAEMFWTAGHRRFAIINGETSHGASAERRRGFVERLQSFNPDITVSEAYGGFDFERGRDAGRELMSARRHPTAIFAANDDSAVGAIVGCQELGFKVPEQVSVCGFDDSWIAKSVWPLLTTVHQPIEEMAYTAAKLLLDQTTGAAKKSQIHLGFELIARNSVAARS